MSSKSQRIALIGCGMVSDTYAEALHALSHTLDFAGVLSRKTDSAENFARRHSDKFNELRLYETPEQLADDSTVDAVIIATPPDSRLKLVELFVAARKPILMEKPVERTFAAARDLSLLCETARVPLGIVLQHRVRPAVRELIRRPGFGFGVKHEEHGTKLPGKLISVEISVPWWREQAYYDEPGRGTYQRDGGGVLINQAIHTMDLALQFTGPVQQVTAMSATTELHQMESEDFVVAGLRLASGAVGSLFASTACFPGRSESIRLYYENVSVVLEASRLQLQWRDGENEEIGAVSSTGGGADPMAFTSDWHRTVIAEFMSAIATMAPVPISSGSALAVHALIEALEKSARSGRACILDGAEKGLPE